MGLAACPRKPPHLWPTGKRCAFVNTHSREQAAESRALESPRQSSGLEQERFCLRPLTSVSNGRLTCTNCGIGGVPETGTPDLVVHQTRRANHIQAEPFWKHVCFLQSTEADSSSPASRPEVHVAGRVRCLRYTSDQGGSIYGKADFGVAVCFFTDCGNSQRPGGDPDWTATAGPRWGGGRCARSRICLGGGFSPLGRWPLRLGSWRMEASSTAARALGTATLSPGSRWLGFRARPLAVERFSFPQLRTSNPGAVFPATRRPSSCCRFLASPSQQPQYAPHSRCHSLQSKSKGFHKHSSKPRTFRNQLSSSAIVNSRPMITASHSRSSRILVRLTAPAPHNPGSVSRGECLDRIRW